MALASAHLTARAATDGHELWRHARKVDAPMAAAGDLLFVASGDAIEGLRGDTGQTVWTLPRTSPVAPLVASGDWLIAATSTDVIAIRAATGESCVAPSGRAPLCRGRRRSVFTGATTPVLA